MKRQVEEARRAKYVGVAELAQEAARVLRERGAARQERGTVTELPDERTVRYYITEGLLSPAEEKQGTASVFGWHHLLQLLVVKKLQSKHLPIRTIRELVAGKTERQLEKLLGVGQEAGSGPQGKSEALSYLESLLEKSASSALPTASSSRRPSTPPPPAAPPPPPPPIPFGATRETWARVELEPGLELHVSEGYRAPQDEGALRRLAQSILNVLRARVARPPRRGSK